MACATRKMTRRLAVVPVAALMSAACVPIPVPVTPTIEELVVQAPQSDIRVSVGPRRLLEKVSEAVEKEDERIDVVDPLAFRDAAFPEGGWYLRDLLDPQLHPDPGGGLGVRYLAIVKDHGSTEDVWDEARAPMIMGAATYAERRLLATIVIDLESRAPVSYGRIDAQGSGGGGFFLIYGLFLVPKTESGAQSGVASAIVAAVRQNTPVDPVRIAILAGETGSVSACLVEGPGKCEPEPAR